MTLAASDPRITVLGLHPTEPEPLPFARTSVIRAFLLERPSGNLLIYSTRKVGQDVEWLRARGGATRQYLGHWHEAMFGVAPGPPSVKLVHHEAETPAMAEYGGAGLTFSERHRVDDDFEVIPIPGHTEGATAYLWDSGRERLLFTGDSIYLHNGKWRVAVLESSDRQAYIQSLELIRELDFDVLVPWVVGQGDPYLMPVGAAERRDRIDNLLTWMRTAW